MIKNHLIQKCIKNHLIQFHPNINHPFHPPFHKSPISPKSFNELIQRIHDQKTPKHKSTKSLPNPEQLRRVILVKKVQRPKSPRPKSPRPRPKSPYVNRQIQEILPLPSGSWTSPRFKNEIPESKENASPERLPISIISIKRDPRRRF